jgi:hypothetical protein
MDELVIKYYRTLLRQGFPHVGKLDDPDIFIDSIGEKIQVCGSIGRAYMHIYISVKQDTFDSIRYLCTCDPTANVVIEILCSLVEKQPLDTVARLTPDDFSRVLGSTTDEFRNRAGNTISLLASGISKYERPVID